eukprot:4156402-Pyramimonas_sp.AAC.1
MGGASKAYTVCKRCGDWKWNTQLKSRGFKCGCGSMLPRPRGDKETPPPKQQPEGTALVQALSQVTSQLSSSTVKPEV